MKNRLAQFREAKDLTQQELADKASVSRAQISGIESGRVKVTTSETLIRLADALDVKVTDIFLSTKFSVLNKKETDSNG